MQNNLRKILIIGNGGSGKTTLSLKLARTLNHPVLHLDGLYWIDGWKKNSFEDFENRTHEFMKSDCWIIEGTPMHDIQFRLNQADTIIFLDINRALCILRLLKRAIKNIFVCPHSKIIDGPANSFSLKALIWVWKFNKSKKKTINTLLYAEKNNIIFHVKNKTELNRLIDQFKQ